MARATAFVFPGQGSQRIGMLDALPHGAVPEDLLGLAEDLTGLPLGSVAAEGPTEALSGTKAAQPLLYLAGLAWARTVESRGVTPIAVAGHSLGELTALAYAGVFTPEAGLRLVCERARLMAECAATVPGTMAAVLGMQGDTIAAVLEGATGVWVANENGPGQVTISGTHPDVERASGALMEAGARRVVPLPVAGPFHSPLMRPAADAFSSLLVGAAFAEPRVPVSQNTEAAFTADPDIIKERLIAQIVTPVGWTAVMQALRTNGAEVLVECGPGSVLTGMTRRVEGLEGVSVETDGVDRLLEVIAA